MRGNHAFPKTCEFIEPSCSLRCISCGDHQVHCVGAIPASFVFAGQVLDRPLPGGKLWVCANCHLLFRWPRMPRPQIDRFYKQIPATSWQYSLDRRPDWQLVLQFVERKSVSGAILDIGCFDGGLLCYLSNGWDKYGIEINSAAAKRAEQSGIKILGEDWQHLNQMQQHFDVVMAMHVIEHMENPFQFLASLARVVKPGGHLIISTGNTEAVSWRLMGSRYWYCTIPAHISFINTKWCYHAAKELNLNVEEVCFFSHAGRSSVGKRIFELLVNLLYRFSPWVFAALRQIRKNSITARYASRFSELRLYPPPWGAAKDQIFVLFQRHQDIR